MKKKDKSHEEEKVIKELFSSEEYSQQVRVALFVLSILNFSVEVEEVTEGAKSIEEAQKLDQPVTDVDGTYSWNVDMMKVLARELRIPEEYVELYQEYLPKEYCRSKSDLHEGYLNLLDNPQPNNPDISFCNIFTISKLAIFLIANGCYNARGRAYLQNICAVMNISNAEYIVMERNISKGLSHIQASLSKLQEEERKGKKGHDYKRYAKIGVVSVGAGALLAFTGGLAAPAVAAALLVFGTSTAVAAAAMTSATVMSGLFGSAGMGLAGYKMARRTRGISEFAFESEEHFGSMMLHDDNKDEDKDKNRSENNYTANQSKKTNDSTMADISDSNINHLSVMICVSGWMIDKEDYKKSFGIVPHTMQDEERTRRFYQLHCPQKVERAADDVRAWKTSGGTCGVASKKKAGVSSSYDAIKNSVSSSIGTLTTAVGGGNDIDEFYQNLADIYGADPRVVESLVPPPLYPKQSVAAELPPPPDVTHNAFGTGESDEAHDENSELMSHILESITIALDKKKRVDDELASKKKEGRKLTPEVKTRTRTPSSSPTKGHHKSASSENSSKDVDDGYGRYETSKDEAESEKAQDDLVDCTEKTLEKAIAEASVEGDNEVKSSEDDTRQRLESNFWHWNQTDISGAYELNLLRWETDMQLELGKGIQQLLKDITETVTTKVLQTTVLAALMSAVIVPYSLLRFMDKIDNIWDIGTERADSAGKMMAHVLLKRPQGTRSVTLVGHSMGARLIFSCLKELYRCKQAYLDNRLELCREVAMKKSRDCEAAPDMVNNKKEKQSFASSIMGGMKSMFDEKDNKNKVETKRDNKDNENEVNPINPINDLNMDLIDQRLASMPSDVEDFNIYDFKHADNIIQDVVLLGTPSSTNRSEWAKARAVVAGRFINGFSKNDIILALIYRYNKLAITVAGLREIHVNGVENIDFSDIVNKHTDYCLNMREILQSVDLLGAPKSSNIYLHGEDNSVGEERTSESNS